MLETLKKLVDELTRLESRAEKYRGKSGRIDISAEERQRLAAMRGCSEVAGELTIEQYVELVDDAIATVLARLNVAEAVDGIIAGEM